MPWDRHSARQRYVARYLHADLSLSRCSLMVEKGGYVYRSFRNRFSDYPDRSYLCGVQTRRVFITIEHQGSRVGVLRAHEWRINPALQDPLEFWSLADGESSGDGMFANQIFRCWPDSDWPAMRGTLVEIESLLINTAADPTRKAIAFLGPVLSDEFDHRAAVVVAQAYPMEFEPDGDMPGRKRDPIGFELRRRAMLRHYSRNLGFESLPGEVGQLGWIWRKGRRSPEPLKTVREPAYRAYDQILAAP